VYSGRASCEGGQLGNRVNLNVHHRACDRLPQSDSSWNLSAGACRQFRSGGNDHGRMPWITRFRISEGVLGASSALSRMEIQGLGVPNRQPRSACPRQGLATAEASHQTLTTLYCVLRGHDRRRIALACRHIWQDDDVIDEATGGVTRAAKDSLVIRFSQMAKSSNF
jgi:hypothetical protein